ncbi:MAG: 4Fe-4S dicluster domain-containing protein [Cyanobacteriota bacterium]
MYIIEARNIYPFLNSLKGDVYAPIKLSDNTVSYGLLNDGELVLEAILPVISPAAVLFPQKEKLLYFESTQFNEITNINKNLYLFGVRSCDLAGIIYTDKFFCEHAGYCDNYYYQKRSNTVVISLASDQIINNTFKTPIHFSYISESGFDLQFIFIEQKYFVDVGTPKGQELIDNNIQFFNSASNKDLEILDKIKLTAKNNLPSDIPVDKAIKILINNQDEESFWEEISYMCIECGGCSYSCPTCTCFTIYDLVYSTENNFKSGYRCRSWDSCIYSSFTRETSGHNQRNKQYKRIRNWVTHKLKDNIKTFGKVSCSGCGRCYSSCPTQLGIITIINNLVDKFSTEGQ